MSKQIDERIVEMRFENAKFEKNVAKTMSTLDKLKEKLAFKNAKDGFDDIQKSANKVSFEHLVKSVDKLSETVSHRSGIMGGVFEELGRKIVNVFDNAFSKVQNMVNQVTFEPIMTGFSEYELKTNSVQVIAANTGVLMRDSMKQMGKSAEAVTDAFDAMELAWDVLQGKYGTGVERMEALGDRYEKVQSLVNKIASGEIKMGDSVSSATEELEEQIYTMEDIEKVLDDLNTYADKTIYNYAQMTDAIGQFTVQGVDLYDAASAVQGMANLAAFTGSDAATTARVMREAAKGLATGYINLQDWMSFETAGGMGGKEFQEQLMATADKLWETDEAYREYVIDATHNAKGLNTVVHENTENISSWIDEQGRFRDSLKGGWLNDTVLIETLHKFAGDLTDAEYAARGYTEEEIKNIQALGQVAFEAATKSKTFTQMWDAVTEAAQSSWTTTWEYIFGHFYDARNLWTDIGNALSEVIDDFNESRNTALKFWASSPFGRRNWLKGMSNLWGYFRNIFYSFKNAWESMMGSIDGKKLVEWSTSFRKMTDALNTERAQLTIAIMTKLLATFLMVLSKGVEVIKIAGRYFSNFIKNVIGLTDLNALNNVADDFMYFVASLLEASALSERVSNILETLFGWLRNLLIGVDIPVVAQYLMDVIETTINLLHLLAKIAKAGAIVVGTVLTYILNMIGITFDKNNANDILYMVDAFILFIDTMLDLEAIPSRVTSALDKFFTFIKNIPLYIVGGAILINETIKEFTGIDILGIFGTIFNNIKSLVTDAGAKITEFIEKFKNAKTVGDKIKIVLAEIGSIVKTLFSGVLDFSNPFISKIKEFIEGLVNKNNLQRLTQLAVLAARMYLLAKVITSTKVITAIAKGVEEFVKVVVEGSKGAFDAFTGAFNALSRSSNAQLIFSIAAAILALAAAVYVISKVPSEKMEEVLSTLLMIFGGMLVLFKGLKGMLGGLPEKAVASVGSVLIGIGIALLGVAFAVKIISKIGEEDLIKAVIGMAVIIGALSILVKSFAHTKRAKHAVGVAVGINLLMGALVPLISSLGMIMLLLKHESYEGQITTALLILAGLLSFVAILTEILSVTAAYISSAPSVASLLVIGSTMTEMAMVVLIMVGALYLIMKVMQSATREGEVGEALNILAWLEILLAGLMAVVMVFSKFLKPSSVAGLAVIGLTMLGLEVAILAMVGILYLIMKVMQSATREGEVGEALEILVVLVIMLGAFTALIMGFSSVLTPAAVGGILVIGLTMLMLAGAISIMATALNSLLEVFKSVNLTTENGKKKFMATMASFLAIWVVLAITMAGLIAAATIIPPGGALKLVAIGLVILAIAKGTEIMVNALKRLMEINYDDSRFSNAIKILGAIMLVLTIIALVMGLLFGNTNILSRNRFNFRFNPFLMFGNSFGGAGGVSKIGTLLAGLGITILAIVAAVWIVLDAFAKLIDLANRWDSENGKDKIVTVITGFCQAFTESAPAIKESASAFNDMLMSFLYGLIDDVLNLLKALLDFLVAGVTYIARSISDILIGLLNGLAGTDLTTWYEVLGSDGLTEDMMSAFIQSAEDAPINKLINAIVAFIALFIYGVGDAIINNAGPLATAIAYFIVALYTLGVTLWSLVLQAFFPELDIDTVLDYFSDFGTNMVDGYKIIWNTEIKPALSKLYDKIASGLLFIILGALYSIAYGAQELINSIFIDPLNKIISSLPGLGDYTAYGRVDFTSGLADMMSIVKGQSDEATEAVDTTTESIQNFAATMDALNAKTAEPQIKMNPMFSTDTDEFNKKLFDAGNTGGKESVKGFNEAWKIHSPSEVGEEAGGFIGEGVVNGFVGYFNSPEAQEKLLELKNSLPKVDFSSMYDSTTSQFNLDPSQVFNLNTDSMGDDLMQSGFGDTFSGMSLNMGNVSTDLADVNNYTQEISDALANEGGKFYDDTDVVNAIEALTRRIDTLSSDLQNYKVVMDTNALVGQMVGPMDAALGQRAVRQSRGN